MQCPLTMEYAICSKYSYYVAHHMRRAKFTFLITKIRHFLDNSMSYEVLYRKQWQQINTTRYTFNFKNEVPTLWKETRGRKLYPRNQTDAMPQQLDRKLFQLWPKR